MSADDSVDPSQVLGESDWDEQDLLTIDEASERLEAEIAVLRTSLETQEGDGERDKTVHRLGLMERVLQSLKEGPSPTASATPKH